jgi:predicted nucleotidyltransferase
VIDFEAALRALANGGVRFIVVGGAAATAHGSARLTQDIDLVYERSEENITRLTAALEAFDPYLRGAPPGLPFRFDAETVKHGLNFTLTTTIGDLDLLGEVVGGGRYPELVGHTAALEVFGIECRVVDLVTLIALKRAAGRVKDLEAIAELEEILDLRGEGTGR